MSSHILVIAFYQLLGLLALCNKATIHQVTTMLATSKYVLFPARLIIKVLGHQHRWLAVGYFLEIRHFRGG